MLASKDGWAGDQPWKQWPLPAAPLSLYMPTLSALIRRGFMPLLIAYLGVTAVGALVQSPNWIAQILQAAALSNPGQADWLIMVSAGFSLVSLPLTLLYTIFFMPVAVSLQRIARLSVLAPDEIPTLGSALRQIGRRYGHTLGFTVLATLLIIAGICFLVLPGIAVGIMLFAGSYLVVNGVPLTEGFLASIRLVAANWLLMLIYFGVVLVLVVIWIALAVGMSFGATLALGPWGGVGAGMLTSIIGYVIGLPAMLFGSAVLITMEAGSYGIDVELDPEMGVLEA